MEIQRSIVSILTKEDSVSTYAGTGFLVGDGVIITCAHIMPAAREVGGQLHVQFGKHDPVSADIIAFSPTTVFDVAVLRPAWIPDDVPCLPLAPARASVDHTFKVYGYPEISMDIPRLAGEGHIVEMVQDVKGQDFLQLNSEQITKGYSGSPLWDMEIKAVVGMVTWGITLKPGFAHHGTSFAISSETLRQVYPALELLEPKIKPTKSISSIEAHSGSIDVDDNAEVEGNVGSGTVGANISGSTSTTADISSGNIRIGKGAKITGNIGSGSVDIHIGDH